MENGGGSNSDNIIIIKKGKGGHGGHHGGAWKVAYADFVTAMMALFIVLWILGQSEEVKQNVAGYFNDPVGFGVGRGPGVIDGSPKQSVPGVMDEFMRKEREIKRLSQMGEELLTQLKKNEDFENIVDQIDVQITEEGLRIEIMESTDDVFFKSGSADLNSNADQIMKIMGKQFSELKNFIVIEGHTDARKYPGGESGYSNYELSADRANAARRALIHGGVKVEQIDEIRGYAANRLRNPKDPYDHVNRRISIIVKYSAAL